MIGSSRPTLFSRLQYPLMSNAYLSSALLLVGTLSTYELVGLDIRQPPSAPKE